MYLAAKVLVPSIDELFSATAVYKFWNEIINKNKISEKTNSLYIYRDEDSKTAKRKMLDLLIYLEGRAGGVNGSCKLSGRNLDNLLVIIYFMMQQRP